MRQKKMATTSVPEELDFNPFFRALQEKFLLKFKIAQQNCWLICIPQTRALEGIQITDAFVDTHLLKPSPFFKGQYVTADKEESRALELDEEEFRTISGFPFPSKVRILGDELGYNQDLKPYHMYIIERPFDSVHLKVNNVPDSSPACLETKRITFAECKSFLYNFPQYQAVLEKLDRKLKQFKDNYMILPQYLDEAAQKLHDIVQWTLKNLLEVHSPALNSMDPLALEIATALESYILGSVHQKLFGVVRQKCVTADRALADRLKELHTKGLTADQLGVNEVFCGPVPHAVVEMAALDNKITPVEKLNCLKTTLELMAQDIEQSVQELDPLRYTKDIPHLTSDDLIPLLVSLLVQVRPQYLESNLFYIQNFHWMLSAKDKLSYTLVTFQAAKEYIKSQHFSIQNSPSMKYKREMSLEQLMEVTVELQRNIRKEAKDNSPTESKIASPFERQLQRITKMIEASTKELRQQSPPYGSRNGSRRSGESSLRPLQQEPTPDGLGEFLSGLQQNCLGVSYGKQV